MEHIFNSTGYKVYKRDIVRAEGCYVYSEDGKKYLDLESGVWALPLGHCNPDVNNAVHEQVDRIMHCGYKYYDPMTEKCAVELTRIVGFENGKCVFLTSGSEAVEYGVQLAKSIRPGKRCISLEGQYLSAYGICTENDGQEWEHIKWKYHDQKSVEQYYEEISSAIDFSQVGVFVFEAGNSSGLVKLPPKNLVHALQQLASENNVVIVVDEVTCGIGRTGKWFGYMHYDLHPHIVAAGKGLGNGYPVSAVIMDASVASEGEKVKFHFGQSHQNDPLGSRVAYEVLAKIKREHLLDIVNETAAYFMEKYKDLQQEIPIISEVRGVGLLLCIELNTKVSCEQMNNIEQKLFELGFMVAVKSNERVVRTYCPLIITMQMIDKYIEALRNVLHDL